MKKSWNSFPVQGGGDAPLVLAAEETAALARLGIAATVDAAKYHWDVAPRVQIKAVLTSAGLVDTAATGETVGIVLDATSFYAESGGQVSDRGMLEIDGAQIEIYDVQTYAGFVLHLGVVKSGAIRVGGKGAAKVDYERRRRVAPNHTFSHVLNHALVAVLGDGVAQKVRASSETMRVLKRGCI